MHVCTHVLCEQTEIFSFFFHFFSCPIWVHGGAHGGAGFCTFTTPHCATPHHLCPKTPLWCPLRPTRLKIILHTRIYQVFWFFKYFGHFCHFWAFWGRSPPKKWPSAHRIQCGVYLRVPTPSTNPTMSSDFWHLILLWPGVWFDTPQWHIFAILCNCVFKLCFFLWGSKSYFCFVWWNLVFNNVAQSGLNWSSRSPKWSTWDPKWSSIGPKWSFKGHSEAPIRYFEEPETRGGPRGPGCHPEAPSCHSKAKPGHSEAPIRYF